MTNKSKRDQIELVCQDNTRATTEILGTVFKEYAEYRTQLSEYDAYCDRVHNESTQGSG